MGRLAQKSHCRTIWSCSSDFFDHRCCLSDTEDHFIRVELQNGADLQPDVHLTIGKVMLAVFVPLVLVDAHVQFHRYFQLRKPQFPSAVAEDLPDSFRFCIHIYKLRLLHQLLTDFQQFEEQAFFLFCTVLQAYGDRGCLYKVTETPKLTK